MYKLLLATGAAALVLAAPVAADPGKSQGHARHGQTTHQAQGKQQGSHSTRVYQGRAASRYWGSRSCPPGLARKNNGCLPPGIAKRSFNVGDRWNGSAGQWSYNQIPTDWRNQYNLGSDDRYYYRDGYLYGVDPKTRLVETVIQALIR